MLDVRRLHLLHDLSRLGTIAAVAQAHTYTPSAVSQQLAALEREAGVPLLRRTGRSVTFTPAGRVLAEQARTVLAALEQADAALAAVATGLSGPLRIGAYPSAVRTLLPPALVTLGREHPGLELLVTELDPAQVPDALRDRRLDVGLLNDYDVVPSPDDSTLDTVPLLDERVFLAVPEGAGAAGLDDVRDSRWILASPGTLCHTMTVHVCRAAGFAPRPRHYADDFTTVLALVAAGQGVSVVPRLAAAYPPPGVDLIPLPTRRRTRVACRRGALTHPAVAACTAALRDSTAAFLGDQSAA
ncbi:LysR family transcriptional regulator [Winogradskya humida]|uniref:LysR family transcriptional regulator n=1 Tax=Winogradskya humida TaxID=113566 RepID=A0ABQ3ZHP0_9ACTN|nr:LysR family transcriptional regulator [Actinoplanes humidus]GIE17993.1 LysR family transcriptional regulator [Actinoplanes humidus]